MRLAKRLYAPTLFVVLIAVAAGCGSEGTTDDAGAAREDALLAVAQCMRENGVDVPDPKPGERGLAFTRPPRGTDPVKVEEARKACDSELENTAEETGEEEFDWQDTLVEYATCMRTEGIDMPDPDLTEETGPSEFMRGNARKGDPAFDRADDACRTKVFGGPEHGPAGGD
jgi:hypothetical protein